jgi:hypothetical protein
MHFLVLTPYQWPIHRCSERDHASRSEEHYGQYYFDFVSEFHLFTFLLLTSGEKSLCSEHRNALDCVSRFLDCLVFSPSAPFADG